MSPVIDYAAAGPLTSLDGIDTAVLDTLADDAVQICRPVQYLVIQPGDARQLGLADDRFAENQVRPAGSLLRTVLAMDPAPVTVNRRAEHRVVGTCRHFAVLSCALLRYRGIPARVRCGFGTYFLAGQALDHWITEYYSAERGRWVRVDSEDLAGAVIDNADDLRPEQFLTGAEAWIAFRRNEIDASTFGVYGTENWGPAEIRGNAVKDLAALNKVEMLPWDEWGRMTEAYQGGTGADYDELLDTLAAACQRDDPAELAAVYAHPDLRVPDALIG